MNIPQRRTTWGGRYPPLVTLSTSGSRMELLPPYTVVIFATAHLCADYKENEECEA
jgi:hypothetical protein